LTNAPSGTFSQVSAGRNHTCGLKIDGNLVCWGDDAEGQSTPPSGTFIQVSAGGQHSCGIQTDGTLACWGDDAEGQSTLPSGTFIQVSAGQKHTCGLRTAGILICWGTNTDGQAALPSAPQIITQPASQTVYVRSPLTLSVDVTGVPAPSYRWRKDGIDISGATAADYTVVSSSFDDAGDYDVVVTNTVGSTTSITATVRVVKPSLYIYLPVLIR
jgi:hypothetical protein